ncbi:MAG: helix-turn-helix transcriptional regulator [Thermomicrobiales bacterium]
MAIDTSDAARSDLPLLVGRDRERAILDDLLIAALGGHGRPVLISGEAGIGKTALADTLGHEAEGRGALVLVGRCYDRTETSPYGLWGDLFARYHPADGAPSRDIPPPPAFARRDALGTVASQAMLFDQVLDFARAAAGRQPLVLILDDIHWSDPAGLDLLRVLARACATLPLLLVATYRADEVAHDHPLAPLLPLLVRETDATRLELRTLDENAVRTYVTGRYAFSEDNAASLAHYLSARTEGNPLFMIELLHMLEEDDVLRRHDSGWTLAALPQAGVPPLLRQVIEARLARLGADAQRLLAVAAVIGQETPLTLWQSVSGADEATLLDLVDRAVVARVLDEAADGSAVAFAHALIREALYEGMRATRRRTWHRAIAETLIATHDPDPDSVAYHLLKAGDAHTRDWLIRAGDRANRAFAYQTATARFTDALTIISDDPCNAITRCELLIRLARLLRIIDTARAIQYAEEALQIATQAHDEILQEVARFRLGYLLSYVGQRKRGLALQLEGLAALDALPPSAMARVIPLDFICTDFTSRHGSVAQRLVQIGQIGDAEYHAEQTLTAVNGALNRYSEDAWMALAIVDREMGRPDDGWRRCLTIHTLYRERGEHDIATWLVGSPLIWTALVYRTDDRTRLREMNALLDARVPQADELFARLPIRLLHLPMLYIEGAWAEARQIIETVRRSPFARHTYSHGAWIVAALIAIARGDTEAALTMVREEIPAGAATAPGNDRYDVSVFFQRIAAILAMDMGTLVEARTWLEAHDRWLLWSGAVLGQAEGHLLWARYHRASGDAATAEEYARQALAGAMAPRQPLVLLAAHRLLGTLAAARGQNDAADRHLTDALALADACHAPYERALTLLARAEWCIASGDATAASTLIADARAISTPLDARPALAHAEALSARLTPQVVQGAAPFPNRLTAREVEALRLLATGLSNRAIGVALDITPRTIERHISNVYTKIGVSSRAEAAAYAIRHGLL